MYASDVVTPAPTSWNVVFESPASAPYQGKITAYDSPIYIADAALYLKAHNPDLAITDPYELTQPQFDAAVNLLKAQRAVGRQVLGRCSATRSTTSRAAPRSSGTTWPTSQQLTGEGVKVGNVVPSEEMTGWADTWMMSASAAPNCMLKWMAWMLTPRCRRRSPRTSARRPPTQGVQVPRRWHGPYKLPGFCTASRSRILPTRRDRVLEDPAGRLRRQSRQDLHRLLRVVPEMDRDRGMRAA